MTTAWEIKFAHQVSSLRAECQRRESEGRPMYFQVTLTGEEACQYASRKLGAGQDAYLKEYRGTRTLSQNAGLWATLRRAADAMNEGGQPVLTNPLTGMEMLWSEKTVHDFLFLPIIQDTYEQDSTANLNKKEISVAVDGLLMGLAQTWGYSIAGLDGR
jgi:hypothetical protein